jgi:hypothetical protein
LHEERIKKLHGLYKSHNDISIQMKKWNNYRFGQRIVHYYIFIFKTQKKICYVAKERHDFLKIHVLRRLIAFMEGQ